MANTYGFKAPQPSQSGGAFSIGQSIRFSFRGETHQGLIENMLENTAVIRIIESPSKAMINFKTVVRYTELDS
ncbi:hypothetical protein [Enterococcus sp.]|uniref:hypothetical protein n=1 Tax=Enterococcus sp. TaxID=35783 RepID=UPI00289FD661|nr:hypothetical protein [Enterococcus sp.]